jgi:hypothetical protein
LEDEEGELNSDGNVPVYMSPAIFGVRVFCTKKGGFNSYVWCIWRQVVEDEEADLNSKGNVRVYMCRAGVLEAVTVVCVRERYVS